MSNEGASRLTHNRILGAECDALRRNKVSDL